MGPDDHWLQGCGMGRRHSMNASVCCVSSNCSSDSEFLGCLRQEWAARMHCAAGLGSFFHREYPLSVLWLYCTPVLGSTEGLVHARQISQKTFACARIGKAGEVVACSCHFHRWRAAKIGKIHVCEQQQTWLTPEHFKSPYLTLSKNSVLGSYSVQ